MFSQAALAKGRLWPRLVRAPDPAVNVPSVPPCLLAISPSSLWWIQLLLYPCYGASRAFCCWLGAARAAGRPSSGRAASGLRARSRAGQRVGTNWGSGKLCFKYTLSFSNHSPSKCWATDLGRWSRWFPLAF